MIVLNESKRDDFLLPYVDMLNAKGVKCNHGQLKRWLLIHLTTKGGLNNLSLGSNFYLAGAVKYYFNGDLTDNKDLAVFKDDPQADDVWKEDICKRLNALILILRNSVIDSIGKTFEQPEDFGDLPINKLLRKYGAKINKELGIVTTKKKKGEEEVDNVAFEDTHVGNGYTFDIIYSYNEATEYNKYTSPGAWCITYNQGHYNYYRRTHNVHYVIFKQNGFENVPRVKGPEWTPEKPLDEYGCSLIALLQKNDTGEPHFITSRWNHGHTSDNTYPCEADHAFTKEEFMEKTGVTDADLQRIFEIWKRDNKKHKAKREGGGGTSAEDRAIALRNIRDLKYRQMRINGGLSPDLALIDRKRDDDNDSYAERIKYSKDVIVGDGTATKSIIAYTVDIEGSKQVVLVDRGTILYETMTPAENYRRGRSWNVTFDYSEKDGSNGGRSDFWWLKNSIVCRIKGGRFMIYSINHRRFVDIDGINKFKYLDNVRSYSVDNPIFYEIRMTNNQCALVDRNSNKPLRLPNGEFWSEQIHWNAKSRYYQSREVRPCLVPDTEKYITFKYDSAAGIFFAYDVTKRQFINVDYDLLGNNISNLVIYSANLKKDPDIFIVGNDCYSNRRRYYLMKNNKRVSIGDISVFRNITRCHDHDDMVFFELENEGRYSRICWIESRESFILNEDGNYVYFEDNWVWDSHDSQVLYMKLGKTNDSDKTGYYDPSRYRCMVILSDSYKALVNPLDDNYIFTFGYAGLGERNMRITDLRLKFIPPAEEGDDARNEVIGTKYYTAEELIKDGYYMDILKDGSAPIIYDDKESQTSVNAEPMMATVNESEVNEYTIDEIKNMVSEVINKILKK